MKNKQIFRPDKNLKLMDQIRQVLRYYHYSYATERSYCRWIVAYLRFYSLKRHPKDIGKYEVERFLSYLATEKKVSKSTQRQALNALAFLYKKVLNKELGIMQITRTTFGPKIPVVMTRNEVKNGYKSNKRHP